MDVESWINLASTFKLKLGSLTVSILNSQDASVGIGMAIGIESTIGTKEKEPGTRLANLRDF